MKKRFTKFALTAGILLAMAFTFSCSSDDGGGNPAPSGLRKEKISGISQKGPFAQGAIVKIYELNASTGEKGNPLPFDVTTDGSGNFKIENVTLASQYIVIEVSGKYFNEVSNKQTTAPITLRAVADVSGKDNVNINVFTHLEYDKVLKLAKGTEFGAAKKAAQKEVLNALGMSEVGVKSSEDLSLFGGSKNDSLLLATSVLLQANRSPTEVSSLLDAIGGEIRDNGALSAQTKTQVASGLTDLNGKVGQSVLSLANNIVAGMNGSSSSSSGGSSSSVGNLCVGFVEGTTREHYGKDKSQFCDPRDGKKYVYVTIGNQTWMAENLNYEIGGKCYGDDPANCRIYGRLYKWTTAMALPSKCDTTLSTSDTDCAIKTPYHQGICPAGWHIPRNDDIGCRSDCDEERDICNYTCSSYGDWNVLTKFVCSGNNGCDNAETKLKATSGWNGYGGKSGNGTDDYGFSALPGGFFGKYFSMVISNGKPYDNSYWQFAYVGDLGIWWSSNESNASGALSFGIFSETYSSNANTGGKRSLYSVRCVKDY